MIRVRFSVFCAVHPTTGIRQMWQSRDTKGNLVKVGKARPDEENAPLKLSMTVAKAATSQVIQAEIVQI